MAAAYTPEQLAMREAQIAYLASDDRIRSEVAVWRDASPEERLVEVAEMCAIGDGFLAQLPTDQLGRVMTREPLPADSIASPRGDPAATAIIVFAASFMAT